MSESEWGTRENSVRVQKRKGENRFRVWKRKRTDLESREASRVIEWKPFCCKVLRMGKNIGWFGRRRWRRRRIEERGWFGRRRRRRIEERDRPRKKEKGGEEKAG